MRWVMRIATISIGFAALVVGCSGRVILGGLAGSDASPTGSSSGPTDAQPVSMPTDAAFDDGNPCNTLEQQSLTIREQSCAPCHQQTSAMTHPACGCTLGYILDDSALVDGLSPDYLAADGGAAGYLVPGDPADSLIYERVANGSMPPDLQLASIILGEQAAAALVYPTIGDLSILNTWITSCLGPSQAPGGETLDATSPQDMGQQGADGAPLGDATLTLDSSPEFSDAPVQIDVQPPPPGVAGFALVVNDMVQTPMSCPADDWEFAPVPGMAGLATCPYTAPVMSDGSGPSFPGSYGCPGVSSVVLVNTGQVPIAYLAAPDWILPSTAYRPGVLTGEPGQLAGVLDPGDQVNITSAFVGGITAILGSSEPFSEPDAAYAADEGTVPWPGGVEGSNGSAQMWIAQVEFQSACTFAEPQVW